ncbi:uncharacterized protein B0H18DRAFT_1000633 [Fomitopsis serialis]|uniref:uncharacterized protein n=1 Tax=Fomitopsis serialis TaxID=139415 RepID=UPI002007DEAB|nr:uncharacterized protein B0H18DRAFT_1000633 [Neoantrodia serialis]KAH9928281.1 hypothetical protein B0H18DRAFT_1000633 [Neoantrodia serialis]
MFATLISVALFSGLAIKGARADFALSTPTLASADLGDFTGTTGTWTVAIPAGQNVTFSVQDQWGNEAWSGSATVGPSDDSSCLSAVSGASSAVSSAVATATTSIHPSTAKGSGVVNNAPASSSSAAQVVGAASSGDGTSAGFTMHQLNAPVMILSALAALAIAF